MRNFRGAVLLLFVCKIMQSCLFSGNDLEETNVIDRFFISSVGESNKLIYKQIDALTSQVIIPHNIDSIGWDNHVIVVVSNKQYYEVNIENRSMTNYKSYQDFNFKFSPINGNYTIIMYPVIGAEIKK